MLVLFAVRVHAPVVLCNEIMGQSARDSATRAFVSVLLLLARSYELVLAINRASSEPELLKAYRKLLLKVHPDKGGKESDQRKLQEAKERWETVPLSRCLLFGASSAVCVARGIQKHP